MFLTFHAFQNQVETQLDGYDECHVFCEGQLPEFTIKIILSTNIEIYDIDIDNNGDKMKY